MSEFDDQPKKVFDAGAAAEKLPDLAEGLLSMLKAKQTAKHSETTRTFAVKAVQTLEPIIIQLFEADFGTSEVLAQLAPSFPDVPVGDLRYAVAKLRERNRHQIKIPKEPATPERKKAMAENSASDAEPVQKNTPVRPPSDPGGENDQLKGESDVDYAMRKDLEALSATFSKKKFIGEN
ncbi:MAG: hypothetical protein HO274_00405 [Ferrovum myxofaciens]|uniref:hypothetical protein n=1 Tax=Ferrovum myxofaciens TaxID=416213 RepID=UPI002352EEF2|nr:hypothetical protein [Ferrovum myxofaciens]QKE39962.1 MAG: hypothetical protein HO274_00405 [Ferrovum myxofaciens]